MLDALLHRERPGSRGQSKASDTETSQSQPCKNRHKEALFATARWAGMRPLPSWCSRGHDRPSSNHSPKYHRSSKQTAPQ
ncbi:hypothetical protein AVEN_208103-1 [Araneus ventricosus]|uniref:Uncharacterized protein n=1 Tax=Araneus ventricosus TaxID=182803 RepID=A0A4Y2FXR1_ARAVE|nr:hypothetical protein AVEN_208103-1 [Araneus ventricosus]